MSLRKLKSTLLLFVLGVASTLSLNAGNHRSHEHQNVLYGEWPILGVNYSNTQVNKHEHTINTDNVGSLIAGWNLSLTGPGVTSQPTYADGNIYFADSLGTVYSANADTGAILWQKNIPNNVFLGSPTLTKDTLYIASASSYFVPQNSSIMAFDILTGDLIWSTPLFQAGQFAIEYPGTVTAVDDLVIVPISSFFFDPNLQGRIMAFNRFTGELVWTVATTSNQFEPNPQFGPGAGSYSTGAVDTRRKLYFVGTGQTYSGVGSPLADSLLAIDYSKGELVWSYQFETNDVWMPNAADTARPFGTFDLDVSVPPNLFTVKSGCKKIDCVGVASKGGLYKIFNRDQKYPHSVEPLVAMQLDPGSSDGTIQSTPVVHKGILYIASVAVPSGSYRISSDNVYIPDVDPVVPNFADLINESSMKTMALDLKKLIKFGYTDGTIPNEAILWTVFRNGTQGRNPITFANGVLYQTSQAGYLRALNPDDGTELFNVIVDPQPSPNPPGVITAGATIVNGRVFMAYGFDPIGFGGIIGGVKTYQLP